MQVQLIRHATLRVCISGLKFLVDPMLGAAGSMDPIANSPNPRRNPLVDLPFSCDELLKDIDGILVTHTHRDHWDDYASQCIPRSVRIICQPEDANRFHDLGFDDVRPIHSAAVFGYVAIYRTEGKHGTGEIGKKMGPVSGFMLRSRSGESLYIAGDTIYCNSVKDAMARYHPAYTIVNCGGARFLEGDPITMTAEDVIRVAKFRSDTQVIAVHMDAINHCVVTRDNLRQAIADANLSSRVLIPADGELLELPAPETVHTV